MPGRDTRQGAVCTDVSPELICSERFLIEPLQRNPPLRWRLGLSVNEPTRCHWTLSENRDRQLGTDISHELYDATVQPARIHDRRGSALLEPVPATAVTRYSSVREINPPPGIRPAAERRQLSGSAPPEKPAKIIADPASSRPAGRRDRRMKGGHI